VKILVIYFRKSYSFHKTRIYKDADPVSLKLPLLYAGILLEGGIVSYDSTVVLG
jgi:hypothetical protein